MKQKGFAPIVILIIVALLIGLSLWVNKNKFTSQNPPQQGLNKPSPSTEPFPKVTKTNTITPTSIPTTSSKNINKIDFTLVPKYTNEPISNFILEIIKYGSSTPLLSFEGKGNDYTAEKLEAGDYLIQAYIANKTDRFCSTTLLEKEVTKLDDPYFFSIKNNDQLKKTVDIYPYPGLINLATEDNYPLGGIKVSVTNRSGSEDYYSTVTDDLGRAVVYTVNPKPQYIKIHLSTGDIIKEFSEGRCLWIETIRIPVAVKRGKIIVNLKNNSSYAPFENIYLARVARTIEVKPNSVMNNASFEDFHRGQYAAIRSSQDGGTLVSINSSGSSMIAGGMVTDYSLSSLPVGDYYVFAQVGEPLWLVSQIEKVTVVENETQTVNLSFGPY